MRRPRLLARWRDHGRTAALSAGLVWSAAPGLVCGLLLFAVVAGLVPPATAWIQRDLLDLLVPLGHPGGRRAGLGGLSVAGLAVALGGAGVLAAFIPAEQQFLQSSLRRVAGAAAVSRLYRATASWPGVARFESAEFADRLQLAGQVSQGAAASLISSALGGVQATVVAVGFVASLVTVNPVLAVLTFAAHSAAVAAGIGGARREARLRMDTSAQARRQASYGMLLSSAIAAKEVRLFGLGGFLRGRMLGELNSVNSAERRLDMRMVLVRSAAATLSAAVIAAGLIWTVVQVAAGTMPVGNVTLFVMAAFGLEGAMAQLASASGGLAMGLSMSGSYRDVVTAPPDLPLAAQPRPAAALRQGIEVRDVWFRYDQALPFVLRGVSLSIPAGQSVALAGLNGSGKSTLVKLLCRFYDPVRGIISWDGIDLREYDPETLRERITCVFQDFMQYELTAAENIGVGDLARIGDDAAIRRSANLAGADEAISRLPRGYDTMISRVFLRTIDGAKEPGVSLSGGQRQRLALARAFMRADRDLLIVDEPMSSMDAKAEHEVMLRLMHAELPATRVLISHRLSAIRHADQIVVLDDGKVAESGTHAGLLASGGEYARLFELQAAGYGKDEVTS